MADMMDFPETIEEFLDSYAFVDKEEVYTNGSMLIPLFRVKQGLEHYVWKLNNEINRQKVENESLKQIIYEQDKEVIKLQNRIIFWRENLEYQPEKIKSEAIKEFAEGYQIRIAAERRNTIDEFAKQLISEIDSKATRTTQKALLETIIEKAAKEMKGDNENERKTV